MTTPHTVLVIAGSEENDINYQRQLQQDGSMDYHILSGGRGVSVIDCAQSALKLDGILLELEVPHARSIQLLRQLKEQTSAPVIVIDGGDTEVAVQAFKNGADDYLVKDRATPDDLRLAMRTAIENAELKQKLERSQETFFTSVENMLDCFGIFSCMRDASGQIIDFRVDYLNAAACENNQMPKAMQMGRGLCEILPAHRESGLFDEYCQVVETGEPLIKDSLVYDDTYGDRRLVRAFDIRASKLNDGFVASWRDVTHRRQLELNLSQTVAELQASQERLGMAMKAAKMGSWDWNIQTGEVHWSTNLEHLFDMAPGSFDGRYETVRAMIHPEDLPRVEQAIHRALYEQEEYNLEFRFVKPDGSVRWALGLGRVFYDDSGNPVMMTGVDGDITVRKRAQAALADNESRLQGFVEANVIGIIYGDIHGNINAANDELLRIVGYTQDDVRSGRLRWIDITPPEYLALDELGIDEARARGACTPYEKEYIRKDGSRVPVLVGYSLVGETREETVVFVLDLSDRKQTERQLQENVARFQTLADNMSQFAWMANEVGWIFWYNQRWFDYTGTTLEEMQGWGWQKVHHPDHVERVVEKINQCFARGEIWEDTFPLRRHDGEYRWFLSRAVPIRDDQGRVLRWFGTNTDITELREAETALRESEERYRCLSDSIPQLVWTANGIGELLEVNQRWTDFTGLSLDQARADGWEAVVHPDDIPTLTQRWGEATQRGIPYQAEGRMRRADGTYHWFLHQAIPQRNAQGQVVKWFGTATDIDAQKQLELERDRLLEQEQTAREAAERANRIKDEFLAILSHELRSPLNPILGWARLLQSRTFSAEKTAEALATIERNAKLQTQLIDDLLDVAKILRGKLSMEMAPVDLATVVTLAIDTMNAVAAAKSIALHTDLPPIGRISGDAVRLQQVVWNLLSNAIKFTPKGGDIDIRLEEVDDQAQLTVSDNGKGIHPNFLPYLFESFRQEDASTTRKYGGLGLGLAIVRFLVEAHRGTIVADSPGEGEGATFTVRFPLLDAEPEVEPAEQFPVFDLDLTGVRILAVDDEPDARELLDTVLTMSGANVLMVTSAAEVLAALESFRPDILVSDIGMPEVDGLSLIQHIRTLPAEKGGAIPAIALTAYAREEEHQRAIASGFQQQVTKPLNPEQLVREVVTLVRGAE
ncbi:MAG: PAS domain-containing protein [Synechococcales bacterium]|nr:PAS domain-containing protein [Synechococcales bacterium]